MAALVTYASSDEEDDSAIRISVTNSNPSSNGIHKSQNDKRDTQRADTPVATLSRMGPILGPMQPIDELTPLQDGDFVPLSPYSANRALLRDLTLPTVPNYDIPSSPLGFPMASTNIKFKHFIDLKKQGTHFNEKLSRSAALRNPSLMQKLMDFSDIDETSQYATTLAEELWDPEAFPEYAYKEELFKSQQKIQKSRDDEKTRDQGESVEFVPATASGDSSRTGIPRMSQKSAAERIMAGLDRGRSDSPQVQGTKRKTRFES